MFLIEDIKNGLQGDHQGSLQFHDDLKDVNMSSGNWLVLARTRFMLNDIEDEMRERGWYF